jgi:hypothetical protein
MRERFAAGNEKRPRESDWNLETTIDVSPPERGGFAIEVVTAANCPAIPKAAIKTFGFMGIRA